MWWERAATTRGRVRLTTEIQTELELETGRSIKNNDHVLLIGDGRENWRSKLTKRRWVAYADRDGHCTGGVDSVSDQLWTNMPSLLLTC